MLVLVGGVAKNRMGTTTASVNAAAYDLFLCLMHSAENNK